MILCFEKTDDIINWRLLRITLSQTRYVRDKEADGPHKPPTYEDINVVVKSSQK